MTDRFRSRRGDIRLLHDPAHDRGDMFAAVVCMRAFEPVLPAFRRGARAAAAFAGIDGEAQAMVGRASQFPAPTAGAARSRTVSIKFRLN
jgi:hypothetical protein